MEAQVAPPIVNAETESDLNERGVNKCNYALYILNWLDKTTSTASEKDRSVKEIWKDALLDEVKEQAYYWQVGISQGESEERNTGGTQGEAVALLVGYGILKEFPTFDKIEQSSPSNKYVEVQNDEIVVYFVMEHPDTDDRKRAIYRFSADANLIKSALEKIEKQMEEFVRKEYDCKKVGCAVRLLKKMQPKK